MGADSYEYGDLTFDVFSEKMLVALAYMVY